MVSLVYLDTSVISAYFDQRTPDRMMATRDFWTRALSSELLISEIVLQELRQTPQESRRLEMLHWVRNLTLVPVTEKARSLAAEIISANIVPENKPEDSLHLAVAVEQGVHRLVTWNFRHMMNQRTVDKLPEICTRCGFSGTLEICSPSDF